MTKWDKNPLRVSSNGKYLLTGDKPFFWLGDTAWLMLQKLTADEITLYLRNRKEKGYNVIQTVLVHTLPASCNTKKSTMKDVTKEEYWRFADQVLKQAEEMGIYIGLLPAWGSLVSNGILHEQNIEQYAHFLGKRYQERKNLIWILGGDVRGDVRGEQSHSLFCREAKVLKGYNPERLITYHPFGRTSSSQWFQNEAWLDFNMFQSGHRRYDQQFLDEWDDNSQGALFYGEDNWKYVNHDLSCEISKPTIDGEPSYEGIPQGLHNPRNPYWEEWDVRRYAYWSVFAGAAGHTYGNNAIMQFYRKSDGIGAFGVREEWMEALHHPGCGQLRYLKELMERVDYTHGRAADELLLYGQKERYHRIAIFAGDAYILCYTYSGDEFLIDLRSYQDRFLDAYWMNPQDGTYSYITTLHGIDKWLACPVARKGKANDWVLVLIEAKYHGKTD